MAKLSTFTDDFNRADSASVGGSWTDNTGGSTGGISGNRLFLIQNSGASASPHVISTAGDFNDDAVFLELPQRGDSQHTRFWIRHSTDGANNFFLWTLTGDTNVIQASWRSTAAGATQNFAGRTYSATDHRWLRIREATGTVYFETSPDGTTWTVRDSATHTITDSALLSMTIRLEVYDSLGDATINSLYDNVNIAPGSAPATPTGLTAGAVSSSQIDVAWDASSGATSYDVRHSTDNATWTEVIGVTSPWSHTGLTASTTYYYQVRAVNSFGSSAWSSSSSATTLSGSSTIVFDDGGGEMRRKYGEATTAGKHIPLGLRKTDGTLAGSGDYSYVAGDIQISRDGGAPANVATTPSYLGGGWVQPLTATELQCAYWKLIVKDASPKAILDREIAGYTYGNASAADKFDYDQTLSTDAALVDLFHDEPLSGHTTAGTTGEALNRLDATVSSRSSLTAANVNAEVLDVLTTDTFPEPTAVPAATSSLKDKLGYLFAAKRNKVTQTATQQTLFRDDGTTVLSTSSTSDDGSTLVVGEDT